MNLKQLLSDSLEERFRATCVIEELVEIIRKMAKEKTFKKYESNKITRNGMQFELLGVDSNFYPKGNEEEKVDISLVFTVCSKLPKEKREKLELFKESFKKYGHFTWCNLKTPLWEELEYAVKLDDVLNDTITLEVE